MPTTPFHRVRLVGAVAAAGISVAGWFVPALTDTASATTSASSTHSVSHAATTRVREVRTRDTADTYVSQAHPSAKHASSNKLTAGGIRRNKRITYLQFVVHSLPAGAKVTSAKVVLTPKHRLVSSKLNLHQVRSNWSAAKINAKDAPKLGHKVATARSHRNTRKLSFHVTKLVRKDGTYAFGLTSTAKRATVYFYSRESRWAPVLTLTYTLPILTGTGTSTGPANPAGCSLSSTLVPSCGVLFGGAMTSFGGANVQAEYSNVESGANVNLDVAHDYRTPGQVLSAYDINLAKTKNTLLQLNWKPAAVWADGDGTNSTVNAQIDAMASSIKSLGSTKIFLTLFHEPENDVSGGASNCASTVYKGSAGTPAQYRAMWANVESRFNADGVSNVVWVMNYMGFSNWNCMVNDLWPGNNLIDWVIWDPYSGTNQTFGASVNNLYNFLTANSDSDHDYLSKPWGLGEFGDSSTSLTDQHAYYTQVQQAIDANTFPNLKLYSVYDSNCPGGDYRINRDLNSTTDTTKLSAFQTLAADSSVVGGLDSVANSWGN